MGTIPVHMTISFPIGENWFPSTDGVSITVEIFHKNKCTQANKKKSFTYIDSR